MDTNKKVKFGYNMRGRLAASTGKLEQNLAFKIISIKTNETPNIATLIKVDFDQDVSLVSSK